jgi:hypothetical protein
MDDDPPASEIESLEPNIAPWAQACLTRQIEPPTAKLTINHMDMGGKLNEH